MTEREARPYVSTHNLAKPPKLAAPLALGEPVEALHGGTHKSRRARYRKAIRILQALIADDHLLEIRVREAAKGALPSRSDSARSAPPDDSGSYSVSDPTGNAATSARIKDPAERAWASADTAMKALWWADTHRTRALRMTKGEGVLAEMDEDEQPADDACTNCAKAGIFSPRGTPKEVGKESTLCLGCHNFAREYNVPKPRALVRKSARGERIYTSDVDSALQTLQPNKPRR